MYRSSSLYEIWNDGGRGRGGDGDGVGGIGDVVLVTQRPSTAGISVNGCYSSMHKSSFETLSKLFFALLLA